ncbi:MAG: glycosyltransferase [Gammaproteobacteria bacterium]|nr:glycosyltransferase [Gammaproteobacteria bacterium]
MHAAVVTACCIWAIILLLPWRPWGTKERIGSDIADANVSLEEITVVIPARDEENSIAANLRAVTAQGTFAAVIVVNDQSTDLTAATARGLRLPTVTVIDGVAPPPGWSGKLWALYQGLQTANTRYALLLDADIELLPGIAKALLGKLEAEGFDLVSVMARLKMASIWEALLIPPFIYFFKMLYPFALSNSRFKGVAAAAGGCILIRTDMLKRIGGVAALRGALIDDCTLARLVKSHGGRTWLGLSHDVVAIRPYGDLTTIWNMVARTAFTQLRYSTALLFVCTVLMVLTFAIPMSGLLAAEPATAILAATTLAMMLITYLPVLTYYRRSLLWLPTLPIAAALYLAMTWTSAIRYWRGERSCWKNRVYDRGEPE